MTPMARDIRILHVDDDSHFSDLTVEFLESIDDRLSVETRNDPEAALDIVSPDRFDCVVSDYDMPGKNGLDFLTDVREMHPELPFILFTGKGSEEVASEAISAGVTDYLQKNPGSEQFHLLVNRITNAVEQTRATQAAEETERRLRELAENTTDALWMFSGDWEELLFVNSVVTDLFDVTPSELYREPERFREHIHPTHRDQVERAMEQVTRGYPIELEYKVAVPDESPRWVWVSGEPILDENDSVARIVGFTRDITERKRRERERRETARRLDLVLDTVEACIWMRDDDRRFLLANERFHSAFGVDPSVEVVGCLAEDLVDAETAEAISSLDDEVLQTEVPLERERTLPTRDGEATYLVRITPLFDETGDISVTCGIATDISDRKSRVERLQAKSERLAALSGAVTGDLVPAVTAGQGDFYRGETADIVESLSAIASEESPDREPVSIERAAHIAWDWVPPATASLDVEHTSVVRADERLLGQLLRMLFRGMAEAGASSIIVTGTDTGFVVRGEGTDLDDPKAAESNPADSGAWANYLAVVRWIVDRHGWDLAIESADDQSRVVIRELAFVEE